MTDVSHNWRVRVTFYARIRARRALARDLRRHVDDHIHVASGDMQVSLYADTADAARNAEQAARVVLAQHSVSADFRLEHWDLLGEAWRDAAAWPPDDAAPDPRAVHEHLQEQERQRSMATGIAAWEVRIDLPSHRDVTTMAKRLTSEGWPVARRRKYLITGANCEDDANRLAQEIQASSGTNALISVRLGLTSWIADFPPMP